MRRADSPPLTPGKIRALAIVGSSLPQEDTDESVELNLTELARIHDIKYTTLYADVGVLDRECIMFRTLGAYKLGTIKNFVCSAGREDAVDGKITLLPEFFENLTLKVGEIYNVKKFLKGLRPKVSAASAPPPPAPPLPTPTQEKPTAPPSADEELKIEVAKLKQRIARAKTWRQQLNQQIEEDEHLLTLLGRRLGS